MASNINNDATTKRPLRGCRRMPSNGALALPVPNSRHHLSSGVQHMEVNVCRRAIHRYTSDITLPFELYSEEDENIVTDDDVHRAVEALLLLEASFTTTGSQEQIQKTENNKEKFNLLRLPSPPIEPQVTKTFKYLPEHLLRSPSAPIEPQVTKTSKYVPKLASKSPTEPSSQSLSKSVRLSKSQSPRPRIRKTWLLSLLRKLLTRTKKRIPTTQKRIPTTKAISVMEDAITFAHVSYVGGQISIQNNKSNGRWEF